MSQEFPLMSQTVISCTMHIEDRNGYLNMSLRTSCLHICKKKKKGLKTKLITDLICNDKKGMPHLKT